MLDHGVCGGGRGERERRHHRQRRCRTYVDREGAWNLSATGPVGSAAAFMAELDRVCDEIFAEARASGARESRDAYLFDALLRLGTRLGAGTPRSGPEGGGTMASDAQARPEVEWETEGGDSAGGGAGAGAGAGGSTRKAAKPPTHLALLRVDLAALVSGAVGGGEVCEIAGIGPVSVAHARSVLGDSVLKLVMTRGVDVVSATHLGRGPSAAQKIALLWSAGVCSVEGCNRTRLEVDHRVPWASVPETRLDNLDPFCGHHHKLKTFKGWALVKGSGRRRMVPPGHPDHPDKAPESNLFDTG